MVTLDMEGTKYGLQAFLWLEDERIPQLEIVPVGVQGWDGVERPWKIVAVSG